MKTPSNTAVIKITENSETAPEDTETITSGSMITIASTDEQTDQDDQEEQNGQDDQGDQCVQGDREIIAELHLESVLSSIQSLVIEGSLHSMEVMESGSLMTIELTDDQDDQ